MLIILIKMISVMLKQIIVEILRKNLLFFASQDWRTKENESLCKIAKLYEEQSYGIIIQKRKCLWEEIEAVKNFTSELYGHSTWF